MTAGELGDMRRLWDALGAIIITAIVVKMLLDSVKPYIPYLLIGLVVYIAGTAWYRKSQRW